VEHRRLESGEPTAQETAGKVRHSKRNIKKTGINKSPSNFNSNFNEHIYRVAFFCRIVLRQANCGYFNETL
jgi:hypothetical protein